MYIQSGDAKRREELPKRDTEGDGRGDREYFSPPSLIIADRYYTITTIIIIVIAIILLL